MRSDSSSFSRIGGGGRQIRRVGDLYGGREKGKLMGCYKKVVSFGIKLHGRLLQ